MLLKNKKLDVNTINLCIRDENIDCTEMTALYRAVMNENIDIVNLLLTNDKIDVNILNDFGDETALYLAIKKQNIEIVKLLLSNDKIDVNVLNTNSKEYEEWYEKTALYLAIEKNYIEIVKFLLACNNIDLDIINTNVKGEQETVIQLAKISKNDEIIKLISEKKNK